MTPSFIKRGIVAYLILQLELSSIGSRRVVARYHQEKIGGRQSITIASSTYRVSNREVSIFRKSLPVKDRFASRRLMATYTSTRYKPGRWHWSLDIS